MTPRVAVLASLLILTAAPALAAGQQTGGDPLQLLTQIAARYRDADYLRLQIEQITSMTSPRRTTSETASYSATIAPGGRFRYAGEDAFGSGEIVSDGTDEWRLLKSFPAWAKEPRDSFFNSPILQSSDLRSLSNARNVARALGLLDLNLKAARFAPDETLNDGGKRVRCTVIQFDQEDSTRRYQPGSTWKESVWIDPATQRILKTELRVHGLPGLSVSIIPPDGPAYDQVTTTTVTLTDFNFQPEVNTFVFTPPAGAKEVATLPTGMEGRPPRPVDTRAKTAAVYLGKPLPDITLRDAAGADVPLSRYRGHPLVIDLWATWCTPCIMEMPALNHIRTSTAQTDLQMIGVDQDLHSADAQALLNRRGYKWSDFAYTTEFVKAIGADSLPLLLLVDAEGKIVYYYSGADGAKGLADAIAKLGPAYAGVKLD